MKNLKKVLALVLAFACAFTMFAGAVVYPDVPAGSEYSEAITMLSDLGIIQGKDDGKYHSEDTITRAEACALIARMLTGDPQVSQYAGASNFTDVVKGSWKESVVGYCVVNGITVGVGNNKFEPDRAITDAEFVTMVVRAMGYETTGTSYPYGHISAAQANGLLDDVTVVPSSAALRGEDAQIIYNALFADYARGAKMINTTHGTAVEEYDTIAHSVFGLDKALIDSLGDLYVGLPEENEDEKTAKCEAHTWVVLGVDPREANTIVAAPIEDKTTDIYGKKLNDEVTTFNYEGDVTDLIGYQVELYAEEMHKANQDIDVKAIRVLSKQASYDYNAAMDIDDKFEVDFEDVTVDTEGAYKAAANLKDADKFYSQIKAGKDDKAYILSVVDDKAFLSEKTGFGYKFIDWDNDDDIDFIVATERYYAEVDDVSSKEVVLTSYNNAEEEFEIDGDNMKVVGDYEEDDVVEITVSRSYDKKEKEVVTLNLKAVESVNKEHDSYTVKANEYYFDDEDDAMFWGKQTVDWNVLEAAWADNFEKGSSYDLWLDANGFIIKAEETDEASKGYLMILDTKDGEKWKNSSKDKLAEADVLLDDGNFDTIEVSGSLKIDGNKTANGFDTDDYKWNETKVLGHVYKYFTDEDGVVTKLESAVGSDVDGGIDAKGYAFRDKNDRLTLNKDATVNKNNLAAAGNKDYTLKSDAPVFVVKTDFVKNGATEVDKDEVMVVAASDLPNINHLDGDTTKADELTTDKTNTYLSNRSDNALQALTSKPSTSKGQIDVALLGVSTFIEMKTNVKVALVTDVKVKSKYSVVEGAFDGKVSKSDFVTVDKDPEDIFFDLSDGDAKTETELDTFFDASNGRYAEVYTNADGKITKVNFMKVNGDDYEGDFYTVKRVAVTDTESDEITVLEDLIAVAEDTLASEYDNNDTRYAYYDKASDAVVYTIDERADVKVDNAVKVTDNFKTDLYGDLEAAEWGDIKVSRLRADGKGINKYYVADIVLNSDDDAAAVFSFTKEFDRGEYFAKMAVTGEDNWVFDVLSATNGTITVKDAAGNNITVDDVVGEPAGVTITTASGSVTANTDGSTPVGEYKLTLKKAGYADKEVTLKVVKVTLTASIGTLHGGETAIEVTLDGFNSAAKVQALGLTAADFTLTKDDGLSATTPVEISNITVAANGTITLTVPAVTANNYVLTIAETAKTEKCVKNF